MQKNGWNLFQFKPFAQRLQTLTEDVTRLAQADPVGYKQHPQTKLLASVYQSMTVTVPTNPAEPVFRLGHTLGKSHGNWRRVKKGLPQRYRLFFMFASNPLAVVIYAWLNDEDTLRKEGSRTDVYEVFTRMLERGEVPSTIDELIQGSIDPQPLKASLKPSYKLCPSASASVSKPKAVTLLLKRPPKHGDAQWWLHEDLLRA